MGTSSVVVLVAAVVACGGALAVLVAAGVLIAQLRRLEQGIDALREEALPLVRAARSAAGQAVAELERVDAVLADTESVTAAVDQAARLAQRAFASPVVKVLAWRAGAAGGWRRLRLQHPDSGPQPRLERLRALQGEVDDPRSAPGSERRSLAVRGRAR